MARLLSVLLDDVPNLGDWLAAVVDGIPSFIMLSLFLLWLSLQACVVWGLKGFPNAFLSGGRFYMPRHLYSLDSYWG